MDDEIKLFSGRVITQESFSERQRSSTAAIEAADEAVKILADAHAQAEVILDDARNRAVQEEIKIRQIANDELSHFVDTGAIDRAADAVRDIIKDGQKMRSDFVAFTPWMQDFVQATVQRITGAMPPADLWRGLISQALLDVRDRWDLVLRCHPQHVALIKSVIAADPSLKSAFQDVRGERSFEADKCLIESASGVIDISIPTQIVTLMFALEKVASDSEAIEEGAS